MPPFQRDEQRGLAFVRTSSRRRFHGRAAGHQPLDLRPRPRRQRCVVGAMPAGPIRRGEVITDVRLLGPRLAQAATGPDARLVPLHVADRALPDLLRPGDIVDIVAAPASDSEAGAHTLATNAVVASVSARPRTPTVADDRVVLVALPAAAANAVAGAALVQSVTLTLR